MLWLCLPTSPHFFFWCTDFLGLVSGIYVSPDHIFFLPKDTYKFWSACLKLFILKESIKALWTCLRLMWLQQCLSCSSFLTFSAVILKTQMSIWVSLMNIEFSSNPTQGIVLPVEEDWDSLTVTDTCHCALLDSWWHEHPQLPCSLLGKFAFSAEATSVFLLQYFSISSCIAIPFGNRHLLGRTDLWVWCLGSGFYINSLPNKLLVIKTRTNHQSVRMSYFLCLSDELWEEGPLKERCFLC